MTFLRPISMLRSAALRPALAAAPRARVQVRFATQDYGSGDGNPAGENPLQQGQNPSESLEHPGPPPPKVAEGKSSSSPNEDSSSSSASKSSSSSSSASSSDKSSKGSSNKGAPKPKILDEKAPAKDSNPDVKQHNEEMDQRTEKQYEQVSDKQHNKDKVGKDFWAGQGGRDRDP
ncbi:hypothetical protein P153DRAFT_363678 [Dothidotthia symphoricarpi CBS 119687]|uniref:Uncharacterized protein n=1 Tax=Dothidotthia symphoricarpi CBS 119687 TaxID=1392245 RepID=A0A6A6ARB8_9PLEO|nr:uncharacterized protein P153DRAFT_363678 [Dothidotthia symphoricarpi CBS 119687]KAF2133494.1 hypothetical protein P153DRAFT_363678 [Dothidotthia symphoricarpi CBS 119687]